MTTNCKYTIHYEVLLEDVNGHLSMPMPEIVETDDLDEAQFIAKNKDGYVVNELTGEVIYDWMDAIPCVESCQNPSCSGTYHVTNVRDNGMYQVSCNRCNRNLDYIRLCPHGRFQPTHFDTIQLDWLMSSIKYYRSGMSDWLAVKLDSIVGDLYWLKHNCYTCFTEY